MVLVAAKQVPLIRRSCRMRAHVVHSRVLRGALVRAGHKQGVVRIVGNGVIAFRLLQARVERDRVHDVVTLPVIVTPAMRFVANNVERVPGIAT